MLEYLVYLVYRAGFALIGLLPLRVAFAIGNALGFCAWLILGKYRRLAFHNLDIAFGDEKSATEKRQLVRRHFQRLAANVLSGFKMASMSSEGVRAHVTVENAAAAQNVPAGGRPIVIIFNTV